MLQQCNSTAVVVVSRWPIFILRVPETWTNSNLQQPESIIRTSSNVADVHAFTGTNYGNGHHLVFTCDPMVDPIVVYTTVYTTRWLLLFFFEYSRATKISYLCPRGQTGAPKGSNQPVNTYWYIHNIQPTTLCWGNEYIYLTGRTHTYIFSLFHILYIRYIWCTAVYIGVGTGTPPTTAPARRGIPGTDSSAPCCIQLLFKYIQGWLISMRASVNCLVEVRAAHFQIAKGINLLLFI